ncbi:MAG: outer membrane lipoprotein chaperone LolA [Pseudomonadota bacterium]
MKSLYRLKILLIFLIVPFHVLWADSASDELAKLLNRLQSLQANFTQTVMDGRGQILQKTSGQMVLQRPGRFRWEVNQPNRQLLVADGKRIWFYDIDLQQVMIQKQQMTGANSPAALLSDSPKNITQNFNVNILMDVQGFYLIPKDKNSLFQSITLIFQQNMLREMRLLDKLGQQTVIDFSQVKLNPNLTPETFRFVLPKDKNVEVVKS